MGNYITYICLPKQPFHLQEVLIWVCLCMCGCVLKCVWVCMGVSVYYVQILYVLTYYVWFHCFMCNGFFVLLCFLLGCLLFSVQCCSIMLSHVLNKELTLIRKTTLMDCIQGEKYLAIEHSWVHWCIIWTEQFWISMLFI